MSNLRVIGGSDGNEEKLGRKKSKHKTYEIAQDLMDNQGCYKPANWLEICMPISTN
jgi:hypothetical protein